ncbi:MAG: transposase [Azonexus sp.]
MHTKLIKAPIRRSRRRYTDEFKKQAIEACLQPGISMASVALANGLNANLLRRWVTERQDEAAGCAILPDQRPLEIAEPTTPGLVPITVAMPETPPSGEIKIEIHRNQMLISITWPVSQSTSCAAWLRDLLR